jgi:hypothetical protein
MEALKRELEMRKDRIIKGALLLTVSFGPVQAQSFSAEFIWRGGKLSKTFAYREYFRQGRQGRPVLTKKPCQISREIIGEILSRRGV